jgi:hypothetical protein
MADSDEIFLALEGAVDAAVVQAAAALSLLSGTG